VITQNVGVLEVEAQEELVVYPNPSTGTIRVSSVQEGTLKIMNVLGRIVTTKTIKAGINTIHCTDLETGVYLLNLETEQGVQQSKLIIE
jgi:hypothetical protein